MFVYVVTRSLCGDQYVAGAFASESDAFDYLNTIGLKRPGNSCAPYKVSYETWTEIKWVDDDGDVVRLKRLALQGSLVNEIPICFNRWRAE